jgi:hypothetical protein
MDAWKLLFGGKRMLSKRIVSTLCALVICMGLLAQADGPPNLALNGTATQSTMGWDGVAENAINGNLGDFTHTAADDPNRWWEVDLGEDQILKQIQIYNRASCCGERLTGAVLIVLDADRNELYVSDAVADAVTGDVHTSDNDGAGFAPARYIRIEGGTDFLSLGEVEAYPYWPTAYNPTPEDGASELAPELTLQWTAADGAESYDVYISPDDVIDETDLVGQVTGTELPVILELGTTYYWFVDAVDADGNTSASDVWSLSVISDQAHFPSPVDGGLWQVGVNTELSWTPGFGALTHNVYVSDDKALVDARDPNVGTTFWLMDTFDPGELTSNTTYYWAVDEFVVVDTIAGPTWSFDVFAFDPHAITDPDLLIQYGFETGSGEMVDDLSGHENYGFLKGSPQWVTGLDGGGLAIDIATLDYVETGAPLGITSNTVTVSGWVIHDTSPAPWSGILTTRGSGNLGLQHDGTELRYMWGPDLYWSFSSGLALPNGEWYFAARAIAP